MESRVIGKNYHIVALFLAAYLNESFDQVPIHAPTEICYVLINITSSLYVDNKLKIYGVDSHILNIVCGGGGGGTIVTVYMMMPTFL